MLYRDRILLSSLFCFNLAFSGDPSKNPDTMGGKWVGQLPNSSSSSAKATADMGHTELVTPGPAPKGPDLTPHYENPTPPGNNNSGWGILGFFANLGRKSDKEIRMEKVMRGIEKAESKLKAGIPFDSEDYAAMGTADLTKAHQYHKLTQPMPVTIPVVAAPVTAPPILPSSAPTPTLSTPQAHFKGATCRPPVGFKPMKCLPKFVPPMPSSSPSSFAGPTADAEVPNVGSLVGENPLNGLTGPGQGGGVGVGEAIQGAGTALALGTGLVAKTAVPVATTTTAGGTAAAGGATATTATTGGAILTVAGATIAVVGTGAIIGITVARVYNYFYNPSLGWFPSQEEIRACKEARAALALAKKAPSAIPQYVPSNNAPQPSNAPNPKKPEEPKERKVNTLQRTEAMNKLKENYRYDNQTNLYKLRENGKPIKCTQTGKDVINVKWDGAHGDIEALNKSYKHMGSIDPKTLEMYKAPITTRKEL